jgi:predicted nucleic acid-binding protein
VIVAVDTSTLIAFLAGDGGADVEALDQVLSAQQAHVPPVVISELLSAAKLSKSDESTLAALPILPLTDGYWARAGRTRRALSTRGIRAPLADALICQSCLDHDVALITRDRDFRPFAKHCGLKLY